MASSNDLQAHQKTYAAFMSLLKWGIVLVALVTLFVIVQISS